jgi:hypothetical protein
MFLLRKLGGMDFKVEVGRFELGYDGVPILNLAHSALGVFYVPHELFIL